MHTDPSFRLRYRGDLVDDQATDGVQTVALIGLDAKAKEWRFDGIGREYADGHRLRRVELIILDDDSGPGLAGIAGPRRRRSRPRRVSRVVAVGNGIDKGLVLKLEVATGHE